MSMTVTVVTGFHVLKIMLSLSWWMCSFPSAYLFPLLLQQANEALLSDGPQMVGWSLLNLQIAEAP